ncbi:MAG: transcriptional regulator GlxA family with amidase domain [Parasphingorhabdus sp.]|jgi:transcriptional regulator GlxA family with amidase domain
MTTNQPQLRIAILLCNEFSALPLAGFLDTMRHAADEDDRSRQIFCAWKILSHNDEPIRSSSGLRQLPDATINLQDTDYDYVMVHGGRMQGLPDVPVAFMMYLKAAAEAGIPLIGLDSGSFILAQAGLLNGYTACVHWRHRQEFLDSYPACRADTGRLFNIDRDRITCPGGTAAIDLAVELIGRHCGHTRALKGLADLLVDEPRGAHHQVRSYSLSDDRHVDPRVQRAIAMMRNHLASPRPVPELARDAGTSERQLNRLFHQFCGQTPAAYYKSLRLEHAKWLLTDSFQSLERIAAECGFSDTPHLVTSFKLAYGQTPRRFRVSQRKT